MGRKYLQRMVMQKAVTLERIPSLGAQRSRWVAVREDGLDGGSRDCPPYHINLNTQRQDSKKYRECSGGDLQPHHIWTAAQIKILPKLHHSSEPLKKSQ